MTINASEKIIRELFTEHRQELPVIIKWEDEGERVNELFFCLLLRISGRNEVEIRNLITYLAGLNLLDVSQLSNARIVGGKNSDGDKLVSIINDLLTQNGFSQKESHECTLAICEVAKGLTNKYQGSLQKFLRKYAYLMVEEMDDIFSFSKLSKKDEKYIYSHWLQNALEMPIPLSNEYVEKFCKMKKIRIENLIEAADKTNISVAILDDLIKYHIQKMEFNTRRSVSSRKK